MFTGPRWIDVLAPPELIPLFARGGSVIPAWPDPPMTTLGYYPESIELRVALPWEDGQTRSFLHEDDGTTFAFRDGAFLRTEFLLQRAGDEFTLTATVSGDGYPKFARREFAIVLAGFDGDAATVDGTLYPLERGRFVLPNTGTGFTLRARLETAR